MKKLKVLVCNDGLDLSETKSSFNFKQIILIILILYNLKNLIMIRDSFIFYKSWLDGMADFPPEVQGEIFVTLIRYCAYGKEPKNMSPAVRMAFNFAKPQIDANNRKYLNALKGGAPKGSRNNPHGRPKTNQKQTKN